MERAVIDKKLPNLLKMFSKTGVPIVYFTKNFLTLFGEIYEKTRRVSNMDRT